MGAIVPFIPAIASTIGGIFAGKKATSAAMKRSPEEAAALTGAQGTAGTLTSTGTGLVKTGQANVAPAANYYGRLLQGNRASMTQAVSQPRAAISDVYRGAERNLEQGGVRGAARDVAKGEIARERAGKISSLITGVQPGAAAGLTSIGETQTGQGAPMIGQAGSIYGNLLNQGAQNREYARGEGEKTGTGFGGMIFDLLSGALKTKGRGLLPSKSFGGMMGPITPPTGQTGGWG